jgi:outer membrane lipoprotein LolB
MVSQRRRKILLSGLCAATFGVTGCALAPKVSDLDSTSSIWRGRLAVRVEADETNRLGHSLTAGFELTGNAIEGGLTLYTPIGGTAAVLAWSKIDATLLSQSERRHFPSLKALIEQAIGTDIPVDALFAWLAGTNASAEGWTVDVTDHHNGRITATRTNPGPATELRVVLEK